MIDWHHLFGLTLTDYLTDSNYQVELEKSLSLQQQYLDVVIIKKSEGKPLVEVPDGLEDLSEHNLLTYKSLWEPLDSWAIQELMSSYVIYRKQVSPSLNKLLPPENFRLYAVATRFPKQLTGQIKAYHKSLVAGLNLESATSKAISEQAIKSMAAGVYEIFWGTHQVRLIVTSEVSKQKQNALWHLYSGVADNFAYGNSYYRWHHEKGKRLLNQLYDLYLKEEVVMPYTWEDFDRDYAKSHVHLLSPEERLTGLPVEEILNWLPVNERLKGLPVEEVFKHFGLPAEVLNKYLSEHQKTR
jgi:hypothetical protein